MRQEIEGMLALKLSHWWIGVGNPRLMVAIGETLAGARPQDCRRQELKGTLALKLSCWWIGAGSQRLMVASGETPTGA